MADRAFQRFIVAQTNRYSAAVRKLLSIKGEEHDISFGVHLEDERPEHSFIKGEGLWAQYLEATSDVTHLCRGQVESQPGMITVVTGCHATLSATAGLRFGLVGPQGGTPVWARDTRTAPSFLASTRTRVSGTELAAGITAIYDQVQIINAEEPFFFVSPGAAIQAVVLGPSQALAVAAISVGVNTLKVCFSGYERPLESGELQG